MTVLLFPGLHGSGRDHWQTAWLHEIDGARLVQQRDWDHPAFDDWIETAVRAVTDHADALLVGHSLGAILLVHLLVRRPQLPVAGALLVAPADVDAHVARNAGLRGFAPIPRRRLGVPASVVGSRNDPWMTCERSRALAADWQADFYDLGMAGHINAESGLGSWDAGRLILDQLARRAVPAARRPFAFTGMAV